MSGAAEVESLAAYLQGRLSIKDFEWPPAFRPDISYNNYLYSHLIPEIDLQALKLPGPSDDESPNKMHQLLCEAATTCGFVQLYNHAVPIDALEILCSYARKFFSMPLEQKTEKGKLLGSLVAGFNFSTGYICGSPLDSPNKCWYEALRVASSSKDNINAVAECLWVDEADRHAFSDAFDKCFQGFTKLAEELTIILLQELGVAADKVMAEFIKGEETVGLKLNHYPACPQPELTLGLPVHTDVSLLTLLWQDDVGGLQVQRDGQWISVKPRHDALVVNVGDIFQVWSNDKFQSGLHRAVLNKNQSRHSISYFYNPSSNCTLAPLADLLKETGEAPKFKSIVTSEYRRHVVSTVFKDQWQGLEYLKV